MSELREWLALRRVWRGRVTQVGACWLDAGRPVPCFLRDVLDELIDAGLLTLAGPDHHDAGQCHVMLTEMGGARYSALNQRDSPDRINGATLSVVGD